MTASYYSLAIPAEAEKLQPVFANRIAGPPGDGPDERLEVIPFEECSPAAPAADQQVLMAAAGGYECLAALGLMHALHKAELLEPLECAIDADKPQGAVAPARSLIYLQRRDGARAGRHSVHDGAPRRRQTIAVAPQVEEPYIS
jgi:hypothetical protein